MVSSKSRSNVRQVGPWTPLYDGSGSTRCRTRRNGLSPKPVPLRRDHLHQLPLAAPPAPWGVPGRGRRAAPVGWGRRVSNVLRQHPGVQRGSVFDQLAPNARAYQEPVTFLRCWPPPPSTSLRRHGVPPPPSGWSRPPVGLHHQLGAQFLQVFGHCYPSPLGRGPPAGFPQWAAPPGPIFGVPVIRRCLQTMPLPSICFLPPPPGLCSGSWSS